MSVKFRFTPGCPCCTEGDIGVGFQYCWHPLPEDFHVVVLDTVDNVIREEDTEKNFISDFGTPAVLPNAWPPNIDDYHAMVMNSSGDLVKYNNRLVKMFSTVDGMNFKSFDGFKNKGPYKLKWEDISSEFSDVHVDYSTSLAPAYGTLPSNKVPHLVIPGSPDYNLVEPVETPVDELRGLVPKKNLDAIIIVWYGKREGYSCCKPCPLPQGEISIEYNRIKERPSSCSEFINDTLNVTLQRFTDINIHTDSRIIGYPQSILIQEVWVGEVNCEYYETSRYSEYQDVHGSSGPDHRTVNGAKFYLYCGSVIASSSGVAPPIWNIVIWPTVDGQVLYSGSTAIPIFSPTYWTIGTGDLAFLAINQTVGIGPRNTLVDQTYQCYPTVDISNTSAYRDAYYPSGSCGDAGAYSVVEYEQTIIIRD